MTDYYAKFQSFEAMKDGWKDTDNKESKHNGFTLTSVTRPHEKKLTLAKHTVILENAEVSDIVSVFLDKWEDDEDAKEYKLIEKAGTSAVHYLRYKIPIPFVADRDMLCKCDSEEKDEGTFVYIASVEHPKQPEVKKVVRIKFFCYGVAKKDGSNVQFTYYESGDSGHTLLNQFDAKEVADDWTAMVKELKK
jgi:hypothetical protein